ncbi:MAG TPA: hypothetical protein VMM58_08285 [Bacteroidota bacterium]|nr:hypothetical protein [Bacteroidota bacterium]
MIISILALLFLLMLVAIAFYGYGFMMKPARAPGEENTERCELCRERFEKKKLVERQIGDSKLLYFCERCILQLYDDAQKI